MGSAIIDGALHAGLLGPSCLTVAEPDSTRRAALEARGLRALAGSAAALQSAASAEPEPGSAVLLIAVKPQAFPVLAGEIGAGLRAGPPRAVVSIMAGVRGEAIREVLGPRVRVVRAMPSTPARVRQAASAVCPGPGATEADVQHAARLLGALGPCVVRVDESQMDAFTAVAGSGPAYLFLLAEAMERAALGLGLPPESARGIVAQTLRGAAALLDGSDPAALRAAVTSRGGTTAAALGSLERDGVVEAWVRAITAARDRGRELGEAGAAGPAGRSVGGP